MTAYPIALIGIGKIARDQHIPMIAANPDFELVAAVTRRSPVDGVSNYATIAAMMAAQPDIRAIAICTPPRGRLPLVREAFDHGLDVLIEKPPAATLGEAQAIVDLAAERGRVLYATWHSAMAAGVDPAIAWLKGRTITRVTVSWKEDVRVWHPGQEWIWEAGIGVFDPGINALSVLARLLPHPLLLDEGRLRFPANRGAPIAADLAVTAGGTTPVDIAFDFDQRGPQTWDIVIDTDDGQLVLTHGASRLSINGEPAELDDDPEYARLYRRFGELLASGKSEADLTPFRLVADAFMLGNRETVGDFSWDD